MKPYVSKPRTAETVCNLGCLLLILLWVGGKAYAAIRLFEADSLQDILKWVAALIVL